MQFKDKAMSRNLRIALVGGGLGGLSAALALTLRGFEVHIFEQARELKEVGAGLGVSSNAVKVLRALGVENAVRARGFEPEAIVGRDWTTGRALFRVPLKGVADARFGAPFFHVHRADLLDILSAANLESQIHLDSRCVGVSSSDRSAILTLSDGRQEAFDLVVGCDGIRSLVRTELQGPDAPRFTGNMCWRALIPIQKLPSKHVSPDTTIWMGPGGHIVTYYVRGGNLVNVVAVRETVDWVEESWSVEAQTEELVAAYPRVHRDLRTLLERADHCFKWGLFDRDPLQTWSARRITLLGDAAHPMLPFLGQGAATAIEDAYVLAGTLARSPTDISATLRAYEAERVPRTTRIQLAAREQADILHRPGGSADLGIDNIWLYGYDATRKANPALSLPVGQ
jgi:salicylate hydroxylase